MADGIIRRWVRALFDVPAAKKMEGQFQSSLASAGKAAGVSFIRELRAAFDKRMADLKVALAKGLISPEEFKKQGTAAAKQFNQGVIKGMEEARAAGTITNTEYLKLARTLKATGDAGATIGDRISKGFLRAGAAIVGFFAVGKIKDFIADSVHSAIESEKSIGQLTSALENLGISYDSVRGQAEGAFDQIQQNTRFSNTDARQALANLIVITGSYQKALALLNLTADIAAKRGTTMAASADAAGKASLGFARGLQDLGVNSRETGDLVGKLNASIGGFATREGRQAGAQLATLHNLLDDVKTSFGNALVGSDGFKNGTGQLKEALINLNTWIKANRDDIEGAATSAVKLAGALGKLVTFALNPPAKRTGRGWFGLGDALLGPSGETVRSRRQFTEGLFDQFDEEDKDAKAPKRQQALTKAQQDAADERERLEKERAKRIADELQRIRQESAANTLMLEQGLTEALAKELARRADLMREATAGERADLVKAFSELDRQQLLLRAGLDNQIPKMATGSGLGGIRTEVPGMAELVAGPDMAPNIKAAKTFESVWTKALGRIEDEVAGQGTLFAELGQAWAEGGLKGLAQLAIGKVKQEIAEAIEWGAKAIGFLAMGQPHNATLAATSAAEHAAAAAAWGAVAGAVGGTGGGGAGSGGGGEAGDTGPNVSSGSRIESAAPDVHIYFEGPDVFNPEFQKRILFAAGRAQEVWGRNSNITIHRNGKP